MKRNWKKGLLRLWMVATILWIAFMAVAVRPDRALSKYEQAKADLIYDPFSPSPRGAKARGEEAKGELLLFFGGGLIAP